MKRNASLSLLGTLGAFAFLIVAIVVLGMPKVLLFSLFIALALQDALTGKVSLAAFLPGGILLLIFFPLELLQIFAPIFGILLGIWAFVGILQKRIRTMDPEKVYFGFGDVLGVPLAVTLSQAFIPVLGLASFAAGILLVMPWFMRRKQRRLLPWLIPGVVISFLVAMVLL